MSEVNKLVVHAGLFHTDDVLCAAMARAINPDVWIVRTNTVEKDDARNDGTNGIYVADIGGGRYDHHQKDAAVREDGAKYAACGLLYNEWKDELFKTPEGQAYFEETYIKPIELMDNTGTPNALNLAINAMRPDSDIPDPGGIRMNVAFYDAVDRMSEILEAERYRVNVLGKTAPEINPTILQHLPKAIQDKPFPSQFLQSNAHKKYMTVQDDIYAEKISNPLSAALTAVAVNHPERAEAIIQEIAGNEQRIAQAEERMKETVKDCLAKSDGKVVVLPTSLKWGPVLGKSDAKFVIYPNIRQEGSYTLQCIPISRDDRSSRIPFPESWEQEKPEGCEKIYNGYMAFFDSREHAINAANGLVRQAEQTKETVVQGDYQMTRHNDEQGLKYHGMMLLKGDWYGKDMRTGEPMVFRPIKEPKWTDKFFNRALASKYEDPCFCQHGTWQRLTAPEVWKADDLSEHNAVQADGITPVGVKSFDEWLKDNYGLTPEKFGRNYVGEFRQRITDAYTLYAFGELPLFAASQENLMRVPVPTDDQKERPDDMIATPKGLYQIPVQDAHFDLGSGIENEKTYQKAMDKIGTITTAKRVLTRQMYTIEFNKLVDQYQTVTDNTKKQWDAVADKTPDEDRALEDALQAKITEPVKAVIASGSPQKADIIRDAYQAAAEVIQNYDALKQAKKDEIAVWTEARDNACKILYVHARAALLSKDFCMEHLSAPSEIINSQCEYAVNQAIRGKEVEFADLSI